MTFFPFTLNYEDDDDDDDNDNKLIFFLVINKLCDNNDNNLAKKKSDRLVRVCFTGEHNYRCCCLLLLLSFAFNKQTTAEKKKKHRMWFFFSEPPLSKRFRSRVKGKSLILHRFKKEENTTLGWFQSTVTVSQTNKQTNTHDDETTTNNRK
mgnify:CR=1 FL=1